MWKKYVEQLDDQGREEFESSKKMKLKVPKQSNLKSQN